MSPILPTQRDPHLLESGDYLPSTPTNPSLSDFTAVLRRHRILIALCIVLSVVLIGAYTLLSTPVYQASSVLRFDTEQVDLPQVVQFLSTDNATELPVDRISTEMEVLQGRSSAIAVIDSLGLRGQLREPRRARVSELFSVLRVAAATDTLTLILRPANDGRFTISRSDSPPGAASTRIGDTVTVAGVTLALAPAARQLPELRLHVVSPEAAVRSFESGLKVTRPAKDADLISVRMRSSDPAGAAAAANLLAQQLISGHQEVQLTRTSSAVQFLKLQLDTLGIQLRAAEDSLRAYRERAGVVDVQDQASAQVTRLAQIQADRGRLEAERDALALLVRQMGRDSGRTESGGQAPSSRLMSFPTLFSNNATAGLLSALATLENDRAALLARRRPQDPDVLVLTGRIREINAQLQGIAETYLQGLSNQVAGLDSLAHRFGGALDSLPKKQVQSARLERAVTIQQDLYTLFQSRLKEAEITQAVTDPTVRIVDPAVVPEQPVWPIPLLNLVLSLVLGSLVGVGASLGREKADRSVRSRADARSAAGLPVVGAIPRVEEHRLFNLLPHRGQRRLKAGSVRPLIVEIGGARDIAGPRSNGAAARIASLLVTRPDVPAAYAESFNQLHANLTLTYRDQPFKIVVFTSPLPGDGKTLSAINFALTVAARGLRVLLIDADLRCGLVHDVFGCDSGPGFAELLSGTSRFEDGARRIPVAGAGALTVLPSGALLPSPGRLQVTARVREVLESLAPQFDLVVIDTPPVNLLADAAILGSAADAVLLVVRAGHTQIEAVRYATDQLAAARAPLIGTLLNDIDLRRYSTDDGSYRYLTEVARYHRGSASLDHGADRRGRAPSGAAPDDPGGAGAGRVRGA